MPHTLYIHYYVISAVTVQVANLSHGNFKSSRVMRWRSSWLSSHFGAKSSYEHKTKWLSGLSLNNNNNNNQFMTLCLGLLWWAS